MKLIVLSLDALGSADLENHIELMPNIRKVIMSGSLIKNVETIMPSLTYPIHTTIITGQYPTEHKIDHNLPFAPFDKYNRWNWYYDFIGCETLIDVLNANKKTVTSLFWPVTAGAKIKHCIPEIWDYKTGKPKASLLFKTGTLKLLLKSFKYRKLLDGKNTSRLDMFTTSVFKDLINSDLTDLSLVHLLAVDGAKHAHGTNSKECFDAMKLIDKHVGEIYDIVKDRDDVTLVLLSDHSQIDSPNLIDLEKIFKDHNLLFDDDYIAYPRSCDGSCYVHLKNQSSYEKVGQTLEKIVCETEGLDKLYDLKCVSNISSEADFIIGVLPSYTIGSKRKHIGDHGHNPKYNHQVFMVVSGNGIKKNFVVDGGHIINHAETFARILNIKYGKSKGERVNEIFESI